MVMSNIFKDAIKSDALGLDVRGIMGDSGAPILTEMEKAVNMQIEVINIARKQDGFTDYDFISLNEALKTLEVLKMKNNVADKLIGGK